MNKIGIIGFGALGRQLLGLLPSLNAIDQLVLFDDVLHSRGDSRAVPFDSFLDQRFADLSFYVGIGYLHLHRKRLILEQLRAAGRKTPALLHPSCQAHPTCRIADGSVMFPLCNIGEDVEIERGVLLNNSVIVSHGSRLGEAAYLSPGVVLSGNVTIECLTFIGSGVVVANGRTIGANARIGVGAVVTRDVPEGRSAIGNPLRLLDRPLKLD